MEDTHKITNAWAANRLNKPQLVPEVDVYRASSSNGIIVVYALKAANATQHNRHNSNTDMQFNQESSEIYVCVQVCNCWLTHKSGKETGKGKLGSCTKLQTSTLQRQCVAIPQQYSHVHSKGIIMTAT